MIAWTGTLAYRHGIVTPIDKSLRKIALANRQGRCAMDKIDKIDNTKLLKKGAEASLFLADWHERKVIIKLRTPKKYRHETLDLQIRSYRTVHEPQLMHEAKKAGVATH